MKQWMKGFDRYKSETGGKRKVGSTAIQFFDDNGQPTKVREEVLEIKVNERFRCLLSTQNMISEQDYRFLDQGNGQTRLLVETEVKLRPALFNVFGFFVKGPMRKQQAKDLQQLKAILEQQGG